VPIERTSSLFTLIHCSSSSSEKIFTCKVPIRLEALVNAYEVIDQQKAVASALISPM